MQNEQMKTVHHGGVLKSKNQFFALQSMQRKEGSCSNKPPLPHAYPSCKLEQWRRGGDLPPFLTKKPNALQPETQHQQSLEGGGRGGGIIAT